jgi:hypothetical protein
MEMRHVCCVGLAWVVLAVVGQSFVLADDYNARGVVVFGNLQATLQFGGESSPYVTQGVSRQLGYNWQSGAILPTSPPQLINGIPTFQGKQGPNPLAGGRAVHVINARGGKIFCEWTATFTAQPTPDGKVIYAGDGDFTVVGGTGKYRGASGRFRTLFTTVPTAPTADAAFATWTQTGTIQFGRKH